MSCDDLFNLATSILLVSFVRKVIIVPKYIKHQAMYGIYPFEDLMEDSIFGFVYTQTD